MAQFEDLAGSFEVMTGDVAFQFHRDATVDRAFTLAESSGEPPLDAMLGSLAGWENVQDQSGNDIPTSEEAFFQYIPPAMRAEVLREWVDQMRGGEAAPAMDEAEEADEEPGAEPVKDIATTSAEDVGAVEAPQLKGDEPSATVDLLEPAQTDTAPGEVDAAAGAAAGEASPPLTATATLNAQPAAEIGGGPTPPPEDSTEPTPAPGQTGDATAGAEVLTPTAVDTPAPSAIPATPPAPAQVDALPGGAPTAEGIAGAPSGSRQCAACPIYDDNAYLVPYLRKPVEEIIGQMRREEMHEPAF